MGRPLGSVVYAMHLLFSWSRWTRLVIALVCATGLSACSGATSIDVVDPIGATARATQAGPTAQAGLTTQPVPATQLAPTTQPVPAPGPTTAPADDPPSPAAADPRSSVTADPSATAGQALPAGVHRPAWLGTRPLPVDTDGQAIPQPTPDELVLRRIPTIDLLVPPAPDAEYAWTIGPLRPDVVRRSTWTPECPVTIDELRYLTVSFWGFDDRPHTGEIIVNASWAQEVVDIFGRLYDSRYPIEEMRIVAAEELDGTPTGDGNDTTGFVCRPARGSTTWSQHAYGLAIDLNPFVNPYRRGDRVLPELAEAYLDRDHVRPGMIDGDSVAVQVFDQIGWGWGGRWNSLVDYMHFSANNR